MIGMVMAIGILQEASCRTSGDMPRNPAASQIRTSRCVRQVAAVWRNVCGVTFPSGLARSTADLKPFFTEAYGLPLNATKQVLISLRSLQRPI